MKELVPGLILNFRILSCLLEMNLIGWSVDCLWRSIAEISCKRRFHQEFKRLMRILPTLCLESTLIDCNSTKNAHWGVGKKEIRTP